MRMTLFWWKSSCGTNIGTRILSHLPHIILQNVFDKSANMRVARLKHPFDLEVHMKPTWTFAMKKLLCNKEIFAKAGQASNPVLGNFVVIYDTNSFIQNMAICEPSTWKPFQSFKTTWEWSAAKHRESVLELRETVKPRSGLSKLEAKDECHSVCIPFSAMRIRILKLLCCKFQDTKSPQQKSSNICTPNLPHICLFKINIRHFSTCFERKKSQHVGLQDQE